MERATGRERRGSGRQMAGYSAGAGVGRGDGAGGGHAERRRVWGFQREALADAKDIYRRRGDLRMARRGIQHRQGGGDAAARANCAGPSESLRREAVSDGVDAWRRVTPDRHER